MSAERPGALRLAATYLRVNALNELQYRANLALQIVQSVISLGTGLVVLALVFGRTNELRGWTRPELLAVLGVFTLLGGLIRAIVQPNMDQLLTDVRQGTLDYALTRPADAQLLASIRRVAIWQLVDVVAGLVVLAVALVQLGHSLGIGSAVAFVAMLALSMVLVYSFWLIITAGAFWFVRMDEIHELFDGVYRAGAYPVTIYPRWLRWGLTFLVPVGLAVTVPAQALTDRLRWPTVLLAVIVAVGAAALARFVWMRGLRRYSGASS